MTLTIDSFLEKATGDTILSNLDEGLIEATIEQIGIETCQYENLFDESTADQAWFLHTAHFLILKNQAQAVGATLGTRPQKLKSLNDEIGLYGNADDPTALEQTTYGKRLNIMLSVQYRAFSLFS